MIISSRIRIFLGVIMMSVLGLPLLQAQGVSQNSTTYRDIPQEGIYIHLNNPLLFAGERLYYKVYCKDLNTGRLSGLSKIAYVTLIDKDRQPVFSHKIRLEGGTGAADFPIPTEIPTGNYKVVGYTSWMLNRTEDKLFEADLVLLNPYKVTPDNYLEKPTKDTTLIDSIVPALPETQMPPTESTVVGDHLIALEVNGASSAPRSPITLRINALDRSVLGGNYSLSVKSINDGFPHIAETPVNELRRTSGTIASFEKNIILPELRGELISGKVVDREEQRAVPNQAVVLSLPGDPFILDIARTNSEGMFFFNLDSPIGSDLAIVQLLGPVRELYSIELDEQRSPDLQSLEFPDLKLNKELEKHILQRSIHNQIDNAYAIVKSDTVTAPQEMLPFYRNYNQSFFLDDYTRFNTFRETMVEIVDHAWIAENGADDPTFGVRPLDGYLDGGSILPLVLIDGLYVQDHKDIVDYNSKEIERISLIRDRFTLGPKVFQGLLSIETKSGEYYNSYYREYLSNNTLYRPEPTRSYYFQQHEDPDATARIPDFRYQLYWEPRLQLSDESTELIFYSSDVKGSFLAELKGYTSQGNPIQISTSFEIE